MILCGNGVLCWQVLLAVLYLVDGYELLHDHDRINWTSAADTYTADDNLLARIKSIEELCAAQAEIGNNSNSGYWTALKLNSNGSYQWGHLATSTPNITEELLDRTQPLDRCYVINKSAMKLLSKDCNSLQGVLLSQKDDEANSDDSGYKRLLEHFSYGCIEYELSKCSNLSDSTKQEVPQPWPCKQSNGMSYGSRQVEDAILNCCRTYCRVDHDAYSIDTASGIETKVKKVPKGYSKDVEIRFNTSGNNEENREVKVIIAAQVFNSTERVLAVLLHRTTCDQEFELTNTGNFVLYSDVVAVVLKPNHTDIIPNKVIIYFSHNKPNQGILERKCVFWKEDLKYGCV